MEKSTTHQITSVKNREETQQKTSQEQQIIKDILNFPNYDTNQEKLDIIFLINLRKIRSQLPKNLHRKTENHLKMIEERHKVNCCENLFDFRHIDENKIAIIFKKIVERIGEDDEELTLRELTWLGGRNIPGMTEKTSIEECYVKYFIMEVIKIVDTSIFSYFMADLKRDHPRLNFFNKQIVDFCVKFLSCAEELLDFKIVREFEVYQVIIFTANLFKADIINMEEMSKIIEELEENNLRKYLKYLAFEISKDFLEKMKEELLKNSQNNPEKFFSTLENQKLIKTKQTLLKHIKKTKAAVIVLDKLDDNFQKDEVDFNKLTNDTKSLQKLITLIIKREMTKPSTQNTLELLSDLSKKYENVPKVVYKVISAEIRQIFSVCVGDKINWIEVKNFADFLIEFSFEDLVYEKKEFIIVKFNFLNQIIEGLNNDPDVVTLSKVIITFLQDFNDDLLEGYFNCLEGLFDIHEQEVSDTPMKKLAKIVLKAEDYDPSSSVNPKYTRFIYELFQIGGKVDKKAFEVS